MAHLLHSMERLTSLSMQEYPAESPQVEQVLIAGVQSNRMVTSTLHSILTASPRLVLVCTGCSLPIRCPRLIIRSRVPLVPHELQGVDVRKDNHQVRHLCHSQHCHWFSVADDVNFDFVVHATNAQLPNTVTQEQIEAAVNNPGVSAWGSIAANGTVKGGLNIASHTRCGWRSW